ncbi:sialate O-acetylesterase [Rubritalea sp.]|uniref:sialate O-acetylesterase n=1 Tax=Rubritalea sp. TaxID=2109375 RepID=UPI003EF5E217
MMKHKILGTITLTTLLAGVAMAAPISIINHSFEDDAGVDGELGSGVVTGWTESGRTIGWLNVSNEFYTSPDVIDTNSSGGTLGDMDGKQVLFIFSNSVRSVTQTLSNSIVVGKQYKLTVAVGDRDTGSSQGFAGYDLRLLAGGVEVATESSTVSPANGTFTDVELVYTAQEGDSGILQIYIGTVDASSSNALEVDNVRLTEADPTGTGSIELSSLINRQIVQRDWTDQASLPLSGSLLGDGTEIQARVVAINGNGTDTDWVTIDASPAETDYSGTLDVEAGWYQLELRLLDGSNVLDEVGVDHIGVGDIYIVCGQSNSANFGEGRPSAADDRVSYFGLPSGSWQHAEDAPENPSAFPGRNGSPWPALGDLLAASEDVPIGFVSLGDGSSSVESWMPDSDDNYPNLQTAVQSFGVNGFKAVLWHQGEHDADPSVDTSTAVYAARLEAVIDASRVDAGWDVPWGVAEVSYPYDDLDVPAAQRQVAADDSLVFAGATTDTLGIEYRDGAHFTADGLVAHANLWFDAINDVFPDLEISGLSLSGDVGTLSFLAPLGGHYQVEKSINLLSSDWVEVADIEVLSETPYEVEVSTTEDSSFFRVIRVQ